MSRMVENARGTLRNVHANVQERRTIVMLNSKKRLVTNSYKRFLLTHTVLKIIFIENSQIKLLIKLYKIF